MIRELKIPDIDGLNNLPPLAWSFNYEDFVKDFFTADYFYAFVMMQEEEIIGTGNVFVKGNIGWLANIIVAKECRGKGLGSKMTKYLVDFLKSKGCETLLLIATELGEPVYKKIGFKRITEYRCFQTEKDKAIIYSNSIRELEHSDVEDVCKMDMEINDEDRAHLINRYCKTGLGYFSSGNELLGFYLPDFGRGLVLSKDNTAGIELLRLKHSKKSQKTLLPVENQAGIDFFKENGVKEGERCSRMILGKENDWNPKHIYSYAGGHCG